MRKTFTALRMLLLVASIGFVCLCRATDFTFMHSWVTSSVNGTAYLDCNRDGIKDNTEIGFANMTVTLAGRSGVGDSVTMTTTTDASGLYHFVGLVAGTYTVQFGFPSGTSALSYSPQNTGSQVNASGRIAPLSINGTDDINGVNAGVIDQTAPQIQFTNPLIAAYASGDTVIAECDNLPIMDASWVTVTDNSGRFFAATFADLDSITGVCSRDGYLKILRCVWSASDVCGNSRNVELYVKIIDNKAPTLANVPVDITVKTASGEVIPTPPTVTATDNCKNSSLTVTFNETETNNACGKIINRTWVSADDCGNQVSRVQKITVISVPACLNGGNPPSDTFYIGLPGGSSLQTCLDLGGTGRSISNVQHCGTGAQLLSVSPVNGTCIDVTVTTPLSQVSTDTFCALNCTNSGDCRNMILIFNSVARFPPCNVISSRDLATINTANCGDLGCFCLADSVDINVLRNNYTITDNNVAYSGGYTGCNFDTIYSYTYFTVPDMGTRGPYRLDYWQINGTNRSIASFNTMQQLVDSMNVWDPIGNWRIDPVVFAISGGSTRNTYGQMKITRLANRAYGFLELNLGIVSNGIQMCVSSGFHSIMFKNNNSGCSDTITVRVACPDSTAGFKPHAVDDVATTTKNTPITINVLANDTLFGSLSRPLSIIGVPRHGTASLSSNQIVYTPSLDFCGGKDTLRYEICNANGCDTADVFIIVNCTTTGGTRLVAVDDRITTAKNITIRFRPLNNDTIVGGLLALGVVSAPRHGSIGFSGTDSLIYTPNIGYCGLDTMEYRICNNSFVCDTATIFITVSCDTTGGNLKPIAVDNVVTTQKNTTITINVMANDQPNGALTRPLLVIVFPTHGSTISQNNQVIYTPDPNYCGSDFFDYEICNAFGCDTARVSVTVTCTTTGDTRLVAVDDRITTPKNTTIRFRPINNDTLIGTLLAVGVVKSPRHGVVGFSGTDSLLYAPNANYCGLDTMEYRICNTDFVCDTATIFITVTCDAIPALKPDAIDDVATTKKNQAVTISVLTNDVLNGTLTRPIRIIGTPKRGRATITNNQIIYTPNLNACGVNDTLSYEICNNIGCDTAKVIVTINCDNLPDLRPIVAVNDNITLVRNTSLTFRPTVNDTIRTRLMALSIVTLPRHGTISFNGLDTLVYKPNLDYCGKDTFQYRICDTSFMCDNAFVFINVSCDSLPRLFPIAVNDLDSTLVNKTKIINVLANDTLHGALIGPLSIITQPTFGTVTVNGDGTVSYKPFAGYCGRNDVFRYQICNAVGCDTATVTVKVICDSTVLNKPPVAVPDVVMTGKNTPIRIVILANDTINGRLDSIKIIRSPLLGTAILGRDNVITYTPDSCGFTDFLIYRICNQRGCDTALVTIKVICDPVLRKPIARDDAAQTYKNTSVLVNILGNDSLFSLNLDTIYIFKNPTRGTASIEGTQIRYVPQADSCAYRDTFTYIICTREGCDTADVIVNVTCSIDSILKPSAVFDTARTKTGQPITINVTRNDTLRGADTFRITRIPQNGIAVFDSLKRIIYTPSRSFCGNDTLIYEICNRNGCDTAIVTIKVDCLPPVALDDSAKTSYNQNVTIPIVLNDTLNGTDSITIIRQPTKGLVTILADKTATYTPDLNFCGKDSFQYVLCNRFGCDSAWVRIDVSCGDSLVIFNAISPNQDGKNDGFYLRGIENYPDNEVVVFNRWGNEVYRKKGYRNDEAWQGTWNGKTLPDGTYFYCIYLNDPNGQKYTGYLQIMK